MKTHNEHNEQSLLTPKQLTQRRGRVRIDPSPMATRGPHEGGASVKDDTGKALIRAFLIHAIDSFLACEFGRRDWSVITRALREASYLAQIMLLKDWDRLQRIAKQREQEREREELALQKADPVARRMRRTEAQRRRSQAQLQPAKR